MDLQRLRTGRLRRRRRLAAAAGLLTVGVVAASSSTVAQVEQERLAPKSVGAPAATTVSTEIGSPPVVVRPVEPPDGLSRGS